MTQKFDGDFPVSHLRFKVGKTQNKDAVAETNPPANYVITIVFNEDELDAPELDLVGTIVHETIHAEISRKIKSLEGGVLKKTDFPGIFDYYTRYGSNFDHQQMAAHYIKTIADILQEFDNNQHTRQFYKDISWSGLMGSGKPFDYKTGLYPSSTQAWIDLGQEERLRILRVIWDFK